MMFNMCSIQYMRHLHDKVKILDERTAPPKESETSDADAVAAQILTGGMGDTLMLGDGSGYGGYPIPGGYPGSGGIPDPYAQQGYNGGMEMNMGGNSMGMGNNMDMSGFNGGGAW